MPPCGHIPKTMLLYDRHAHEGIPHIPHAATAAVMLLCATAAHADAMHDGTVTIVLPTALWLSWWAMLIYTAIAACLGYMLLRFHMRLKDGKKQMRMVEDMLRHEQQLNMTSTALLDSVAHELCTQLDIISSPLHELTRVDDLSAKEREQLSLIGSSIERMHGIVEQMQRHGPIGAERGADCGPMAVTSTPPHAADAPIITATAADTADAHTPQVTPPQPTSDGDSVPPPHDAGSTPPLHDGDKKLLDKLNQMIEAELCNSDLSLDELTKAMNLSASTFYRKIKSLTGLSPNEYVRHYRLRSAARMIDQGNLNISEVAFRSGFGTLSYFSSMFKKHYGMTPSEYKNRRHKEQPSPMTSGDSL